MKLRTVPVVFVALIIGLAVPIGHAQRIGFQVGIAPAPLGSPVPPVVTQPFRVHAVPSSPILPMTNPIAPILPNPYIPFGPQQRVVAQPPTVILVAPHHHPGRFVPAPTTTFYTGYADWDRSSPDVTVYAPGGTVIAPNSTVIVSNPNPYYQPYPTYQAPVPSLQTSPFVSTVAPTIVEQPLPVVQPAPRQPRVYVPPPAVGTSRADVIQLFGNPIGTVGRSATETLYFENGLIVVFQNGVVIPSR